MAKPKIDARAKRLVQLAEQLRRAAPWKSRPDEGPFVVDYAGETYSGFVFEEEEELGAWFLHGARSYRDVLEFVWADEPDIDRLLVHVVQYDRLSEIDSRFTNITRRAGSRLQGKQLAPYFYTADLGTVRPLRAAEERTISVLLAALLEALKHESFVMPEGFLRGRRAPVLQLDERGKLIDVQPRVIGSLPIGPRENPPVDWPDFEDLENDATTIVVAETLLPHPKKDQAILEVFTAFRDDESLVCTNMLDLTPGVADLLQRAIENDELTGEPGVPKRFVFESQESYETVASALRDIDVEAVLDPSHPTFGETVDKMFLTVEQLIAERAADRAAEELEEYVGEYDDDYDDYDDEYEEADAIEPRVLESPETLADWKEIDRFVVLEDHLEARREYGDRYIDRFFGRDSIRGLDEHQLASAWMSYHEWLVCDFRLTLNSQTMTEQCLTDPNLPAGERATLQARANSIVSLFRVESVDPGRTLHVLDLRDGERHIVHDQGLSQSLQPDHCLFLRLYHLGKDHEYTVPGIAGPPVPLGETAKLMERLETAPRVGPRTDDYRDRLESINKEWKRPPEFADFVANLQNTSGHAHRLQRVLFTVADPPQLQLALTQRPDIESNDGGWVWLSPEDTILASLELIDDTVVASVNSDERAAAVRIWIERIPGVKFVRSTPVDLTDLPRDDTLPSPEANTPFPPEVQQAIADLLEKQMLAWVDESVPALNNLTPRQAAQDPNQRQNLERLLRTAPNPNQDLSPEYFDFDAVQAKIRKELGMG